VREHGLLFSMTGAVGAAIVYVLQGVFHGRTYDIVRFRNGYATDAPVMDVEFLGVDKRRDCYAIRLGKILGIKRWPQC
jgi:hypothetical protein